MKRVMILILCISLIIFNVIWFFTYNMPDESTINTLASLLGHIFITIGAPSEITIVYPENTTYNFSVGDTYLFSLNVSANFNASTWRYSLFDLKHGTIVYDNVAFNPDINTTFNAARWSNTILVSANNPDGDIFEKNATFFVYVPNSAPLIGYTETELYECENKYFSYFFNATDVDEDVLSPDISQKNPFYVFTNSFPELNKTKFEILSGVLTKANAGGINAGYKLYQETVSVLDGVKPDSRQINITVIEVNSAPSVGTIGVQTIWLKGANNSFYKQVAASDVEDGGTSSGNLTFNVSFASGNNLFNISNMGVMNFTSNGSDAGVYNISLCVRDRGLTTPHQNISLCYGQTGGSIELCQNFSLTIASQNRQPTIVSYYPSSLNFSVSGTDEVYFNLTSYDPDATVPDVYWYADNALNEYDSGSLFNEFRHTFGCDVSGSHSIKAEITDGLLNDSVEWNVSVSYVACPGAAPPGGGGGGGGVSGCGTKWVCDEWKICQNAKKSLEAGLLSGEDYRSTKDSCSKENLDENTCGIQIRNCLDINSCNSTKNKPQEIQFCHYTEIPSCSDGIKNCHDDLCEFLVDCGGPCNACPTCSDKIRNQDEEDIDCGGPCPACPVEKPLIAKIPFLYIFVAIIISILVVLIIIRIMRIVSLKRKMEKEER